MREWRKEGRGGVRGWRERSGGREEVGGSGVGGCGVRKWRGRVIGMKNSSVLT